jgi:uncharacterized membrane protein
MEVENNNIGRKEGTVEAAVEDETLVSVVLRMAPDPSKVLNNSLMTISQVSTVLITLHLVDQTIFLMPRPSFHVLICTPAIILLILIVQIRATLILHHMVRHRFENGLMKRHSVIAQNIVIACIVIVHIVYIADHNIY